MGRLQPITPRSAALIAAIVATALIGKVSAHHSFSMYDTKKIYVVTGVVTRVDPNPNHMQIFFAPLNLARNKVIRDEQDEPIIWALEMKTAAFEAREGISVNSFPPGTIFSTGLHPLRNGRPAGGKGESVLFKCPPETPPEYGKHCDSVDGATAFGNGGLPTPTDVMRGLQETDG